MQLTMDQTHDTVLSDPSARFTQETAGSPIALAYDMVKTFADNVAMRWNEYADARHSESLTIAELRKRSLGRVDSPREDEHWSHCSGE